MNIIAQKGAVVNIKLNNNLITAKRIAKAKAKREARKAEAKKPVVQRWNEHKKRAMEVGDKLISVGLVKRGYRMKSCAQQLIGYRCGDCGNFMVTSAQYCRDRLCPVCNWRLSIKRYSQMTQLMTSLYNAYPEASYALITLTAKNCKPEALDSYMSDLQSAWERTRGSRWARKELIGWARSIEVTYNETTGELHPHYHIITMSCDGSTCNRLVGEWLSQCEKRDIKALFKAQSVDNIIEHHTEGSTLAGAICEVYKYMVKSDDLSEMPLRTFRTFAEAIANKRLISMGGKIKEYAKLLDLEQMEENAEDDNKKEIELCSKCNSRELDEAVMEWCVSANKYLMFTAGNTIIIDDDMTIENPSSSDLLEAMRYIRDKAEGK